MNKKYLIYPETWMYELEYEAKNKREALKKFMADWQEQLTGEEEIYIKLVKWMKVKIILGITALMVLAVAIVIFNATNSVSTSMTSVSMASTTSIKTIGLNTLSGTTLELIVPNTNLSPRASKYTYIPIPTANYTLAKYIQKYAPVTLQNQLYQQGIIGKGFASEYTLVGQIQLADVGRILVSANQSLSIEEGN